MNVHTFDYAGVENPVVRATYQRPRTWPTPMEGADMSDATCSIDGCARPHEARGWCKVHYNRWAKHGTTDTRPGSPGPVAERFRRFVDSSGDCWVWTGSRNGFGYGQMSVNGRPRGAHRVSYEMHVGPIPKGMEVCHRCDNPPCVNPDHLFLGTHAENMADSLAKGRAARMLGEDASSAKLTAAQVDLIRRMSLGGMPNPAIARQFGVHTSTVWSAVVGKTWGPNPYRTAEGVGA